MEGVLDYLVKREGNLAREQIHSITIPPDCIKCLHQVRLPSNMVPDASGFRVIVFIVGETFYEVSLHEWLKFPVVNRRYRIFSLQDNVRVINLVPLSSSNHLTVSQNRLRLTMSQEIPIKMAVERDQFPLKLIKPLWPYPTTKPVAEECDDSYGEVIKYTTFLFDFIMVRREIPSQFPSLEYRWLKYISRHGTIGNQQSLLFLMAYMKTLDKFEMDEIVREWVQFEVYLLTKSPLIREEEQFLLDLERHVDVVGRVVDVTRWQHHQWHQYGRWRREGEEGYVVHCSWLFEPEFHGLQKNAVVRDGELFLDGELFRTRFIPSVYRHVLLDVVSMIYEWRGDLLGLMREWGLGYHRIGVVSEMLTNNFPTKIITTHQMYVFNFLCGENTSPIQFPVSREMDRKEEISRRVGNRVVVASKIEMEDLFKDNGGKYLPPCLQKVASLPSYKHNDRWNLTKYLIDMGYRDEERVKSFMCRNNDTLDYRKDVDALYDEAIKKKTDIKEGYRISIPCDSIINAVFPKGNVLRCLYEEEENGDNRCISTSEEKEKYRVRCACSLSGEAGSQPPLTLKSPMDYIEYMTNL